MYCASFYPGDHRFCPQVVGVVNVSNEFGSGNETISSPGAAGPRYWPEDNCRRALTVLF